MIVKARLQNIQSHKDTTIEFDEGVNAIVGLSDSGKTAILRGVLWVITNKPSGEGFRSYWGGDTIVQLWTSEGAMVERGRTNSDNYYAFELPGRDREELRAFGQGVVPQEIADILNFKLQPPESELPEFNIGFQMDKPFLLSSSSGDVAKMLNMAVNLTVIDTSVSNIRKKKMDTDRQLRNAEENLSALQEQLAGFTFIEAMEADVVRLEGVRDRIVQTSARMSSLRKAVEKGRLLRQEQQKQLALLGSKPTLDAAFECQGKQKELREKITRLSQLKRQLGSTTRQYETAKKLASAAPLVERALVIQASRQDVDKRLIRLTALGKELVKTIGQRDKAEELLKASPLMDAALRIAEERSALDSKIRKLDVLVAKIKKAEADIERMRRERQQLKTEYDAAMGDNCILCAASLV